MVIGIISVLMDDVLTRVFKKKKVFHAFIIESVTCKTIFISSEDNKIVKALGVTSKRTVNYEPRVHIAGDMVVIECLPFKRFGVATYTKKDFVEKFCLAD